MKRRDFFPHTGTMCVGLAFSKAVPFYKVDPTA